MDKKAMPLSTATSEQNGFDRAAPASQQEYDLLLEDLELHRTELSMQNDELRASQGLLEESRTRYADLFDFAPVGYCTLDADGTILEVNLTASAMVRVRREQLSGKRLDRAVRFSEPHALRDHLATIFGGAERAECEVTMLPMKASPVTVQIVSVPTRDVDGVVRSCRSTFHDITELKRSERVARFLGDASKALATSLEYTDTLAKVANCAVLDFAESCMVELREPDGSRRRIAIAPTDMTTPPSSRTGEIDSFQAKVLQTGEPILQTGADPHPGASLSEAKAAAHAHSFMVIPIRGKTQIHGTFTFLRSKQARPYSLSDLAAAEDLGYRAALAIENAHLHWSREAAVTARDEILAIVSHDLKNPLGAISLSTALLLDRPYENERRKGRRQLEIIKRGSERMDRMIGDLLDVTSIERGHLAIERSPRDVGELLSNAAEMSSAAATAKHVELRMIPPTAPLSVDVDAGRILQVLGNLLGNAIKFTPEGGCVTLRTEHSDGEVRFIVEDTGAGVPRDAMSRVFDRFWQVPGTEKKGRGLGLFIARGIVEAHGGRIGVRRADSGGASFYFAIGDGPARSDGAWTKSPSSKPHSAANQTILIVDDEQDCRDALRGILENNGFRVEEASNGRQALDYLSSNGEKGETKLVLLDLNMPGMDGGTLVGEINSRPGLAKVPVVLMSGEHNLPQRASTLGVAGSLAKPASVDRILAVIRRHAR